MPECFGEPGSDVSQLSGITHYRFVHEAFDEGQYPWGVSFDVTSLFTNVPIGGAVKANLAPEDDRKAHSCWTG